jgi:hypothetical protein
MIKITVITSFQNEFSIGKNWRAVMGLDVHRFLGGTVDEELICPICSGVLENPVQAPVCEHAFW